MEGESILDRWYVCRFEDGRTAYFRAHYFKAMLWNKHVASVRGNKYVFISLEDPDVLYAQIAGEKAARKAKADAQAALPDARIGMTKKQVLATTGASRTQ